MGWAGLIVNPKWDVAVYNGYFKDDKYSEEAFFRTYLLPEEHYGGGSRCGRQKRIVPPCIS